MAEPDSFAAYLRDRMTARGITSIHGLAKEIDVAVETARQLLYGNRRPHEQTLKKVSEAFGGDITKLRGLAGLPAGGLQPYTPPREADQLNARERALVDELILTLRAARQDRDRVNGQDPAPDGQHQPR